MTVHRQRSNLELYRFLSYFPKWSFASQSHNSNVAKIFEPIYQSICDAQSKAFYSSAANLINANKTIDFKKCRLYRQPYVELKQEVDLIWDLAENIGQLSDAWIDSYPVSACYLEPVLSFSNIIRSFSVTQVFQPIIFPEETFVYITPPDALAQIQLVGLDIDGKVIKETINLESYNSHMTINRFKSIIKIYSEVSLTITNYCITASYKSKYLDFKRITDKDGAYFEPVFTVDEFRYISVTSNDREVYNFYMDRIIDDGEIFVTDHLDIYFLSAGDLYASKPYLNVPEILASNSTFNNNKLINVTDTETRIGDDIVLVVNNDMIKRMDYTYKVSMIHNGIEQYFDADGILGLTPVLINANQYGNSFKFTIPRVDNLSYVFKLEMSNIEESYFCGVTNNMIVSYKLLDDVSTIAINNGSLYITTSNAAPFFLGNVGLGRDILIDADDEFIETLPDSLLTTTSFKVSPIRLCYMHDGQYLYTDSQLDLQE